MIESRCGLLCSGCSYKESHGCGGCIETNGNPFHGECSVAKCCQDKGYTYCGECPQLPSDCGSKLSAYSFADIEHGDGGMRIEQCRKWAEEGQK